MAATGSRNDPYASFNFVVEIDGVGVVGGFSECTGFNNESGMIEYRTGDETNTVRKLPGLVKYSNLTLKRGFTADKALWTWRKTVIDGKTERHSGSITLRDESGKPAHRWNFREGWPSKLEGPSFNAKSNDVAIETMEITVEHIEME